MHMPGTTSLKSHLRVGRWLLGALILALLFRAAFLMTTPPKDSLFVDESRFVVTPKPPSATFRQRAFAWWRQIKHRFGGPPPLTRLFYAGPEYRTGIYSLLAQCAEDTGVRYVVAREVAFGGSVMFAHTNTMTAWQLANALTEAVQTGQPEWWDPLARRIRKENLVVLTNDARTVLVLPKEMAREFQRKKVN
jgi:hypothetical protein